MTNEDEKRSGLSDPPKIKHSVSNFQSGEKSSDR